MKHLAQKFSVVAEPQAAVPTARECDCTGPEQGWSPVFPRNSFSCVSKVENH